MTNSPQQMRFFVQAGRILPGRVTAVLIGVLAGGVAAGQDLVTPPSGSGNSGSLAPAYLPNTGIYQAPPMAPNPLPPLMHWGELSLRPALVYRFLDGDGIPVSTNRSYQTLIQEISPGMVLALGSQWVLDYTPTERLYSNHNFVDGLDQYVNLRGGATNEATVLSLGQIYSHSTAPLVETGAQTETDVYSTTLGAVHRFNGELSLDAGLAQNFRFTTLFQGYRDWSTMDWLGYQVSPRVNVAAGLGVGYTEVINSVNSLYEQAQGRVNWRLTDHFSFGVSGGVEERQLMQTGGGNLSNPIFGASVLFAPSLDTIVSLGASRVISVSYQQGDLTESTSLELSLTQKILERLSLQVNGAFREVSYVNVENASVPGLGTVNLGTIVRTDDSYSLSTQLIYSFSQRGRFALLYRYRSNQSNNQGYSLTSNQIGFEVAYRY